MTAHEGYTNGVKLTISLCLVYTLCIACVRIWIRKGASGSDDFVIAAATLVALGHTAADYITLAEGLGTPWQRLQAHGNVRSLDRASIAGVVTFIVALYLSKCAMLAFLARITKSRSQFLTYHIFNVVVAIIGVVSVLLVTVDCRTASGYYWNIHDNRLLFCPSQSSRWVVFAALDIVTEFVLLVLPVQLVWSLQMKRSRKAMILLAFSLRLPVVGLSIGRNYYTLQLRLPQTDPGLGSGLVVIWLEIQLAYALAASTLSASKGFAESFNSGFGLAFARGKDQDTYGYGLSDASGQTPSSSKTEKSREGSALESGLTASRSQSLPQVYPGKHEISSPIPMPSHEPRAADTPLKLRPETVMRSSTHISTDPDLGPWLESSSMGARSSDENMVIVRETGYEVQHDQAPILGAG